MEYIEIKIKSKKNDNEFFISQMNANPENNNEENNNILSNNNLIQPINNNITYDDTNIVEEMINKNINLRIHCRQIYTPHLLSVEKNIKWPL